MIFNVVLVLHELRERMVVLSLMLEIHVFVSEIISVIVGMKILIILLIAELLLHSTARFARLIMMDAIAVPILLAVLLVRRCIVSLMAQRTVRLMFPILPRHSRLIVLLSQKLRLKCGDMPVISLVPLAISVNGVS